VTNSDQIPFDEEELLIGATYALRKIPDEPPGRVKVDRQQAALIWRAMAADILPDAEVRKWCRLVARRIVTDVLETDPTAVRKSGQAVDAIYLQGRAPVRLEMKEEADLVWTMLSAALETWVGKRKGRISYLELAKKMQDRGHFKDKTTNAVAEFLRRADKHKNAL